jgi:hypothetical protein
MYALSTEYLWNIYGVSMEYRLGMKKKPPRPAATPQEGNIYILNTTKRVFSPDRSGTEVERIAGLNILKTGNVVLQITRSEWIWRV